MNATMKTHYITSWTDSKGQLWSRVDTTMNELITTLTEASDVMTLLQYRSFMTDRIEKVKPGTSRGIRIGSKLIVQVIK